MKRKLIKELNTIKSRMGLVTEDTNQDLIGKRVMVYYNLHKHTFSVQYQGKVVLYADYVKLSNVEFRVREGGKEKVRKEMRKNVHAGVVGKIKDSGGNYDTSGWTLVTYNPYQHDSFVEYETGRPIYKAKEAILKNENEVWAKK